ncbi:hypothetical protein ACZ90_39390 [Streptomyces albus subsp. albus]|nr:hypothetical protein ACZ90_39390 [Streptomyces albus subsp. albus]
MAPAPVCGERRSRDFPLRAELRDGPSAFPRGGYWRAWHLELHNTTRTGCRAIHPVVVLADRGRKLRPRDIRFEFYDERSARWRPVRFETTDEDENVGVFTGGGFAGFTVPAHRDLTVALRSRFAADGPTGRVTANVTAIQRRGADGDWVGQSRDVAFRITESPARRADRPSGPDGGRRADPDRRTGPGTDPGRRTAPGTDPDHHTGPGTDPDHRTAPGADPGRRTDPGTPPDHDTGPGKESGWDAGTGTRPGETGGSAPARPPGAAPSTGADAPAGRPGTLAETGHPGRAARRVLLPLSGIAAAALLTGTALVSCARRLRRR